MSDQQAIIDQIRQAVGPRPEAATDWRFLGIPLNASAHNEYLQKQREYDIAFDRVAAQLAPQATNPFRNSTLGEVSAYTNRPLESIATPDQYIEQTREEPSLVPATRMHYTRAGDFPMGNMLVPEAVQLQGPPNLLQPNPLDTGSTRGMVEQYPLGIQQTPRQVQLQGPPNPLGPELYERPGDPLEVTTREPNPHARATLPQQLLGVSNLEHEARWPRGMGGQSQFKYNQILSAYGKDAADYWLAEGMLPGGVKERALETRTDTNAARGGLINAQTQGQQIRNEYAPEEYQDKHANAQSLQRYRENAINISQQLLPYRKQLMDAEAQLKSGRLTGDTPDMRMQQERIDLAKKRFDFLAKLLVSQKGEVNDETRELLQQDLAEIAGLVGEIGKQSLLQSMFGETPKPQRVQPGGQSKQTPAQSQPAAPDETTTAINELLRSRGVDAAQAQQSGVKYQGKLYKFKDGKWSE